jgi:hypothetical protein
MTAPDREVMQPPDADEMEEAMSRDALIYELSVELMRLDGNEGDPHQLVWCGGPTPEPWGDVWHKYEPQAETVLNAIGEGSAHELVKVVRAAFDRPAADAQPHPMLAGYIGSVLASGKDGHALIVRYATRELADAAQEWLAAASPTPIGTADLQAGKDALAAAAYEPVLKNLAPPDSFHPQFVSGFWHGHAAGRERGKKAASGVSPQAHSKSEYKRRVAQGDQNVTPLGTAQRASAEEAARTAFEQDARTRYPGLRLIRHCDGYVNPGWDGEWRAWLRSWNAAVGVPEMNECGTCRKALPAGCNTEFQGRPSVTSAPDWRVFSFLEHIYDDKAVPERHRKAAAQLHESFATSGVGGKDAA